MKKILAHNLRVNNGNFSGNYSFSIQEGEWLSIIGASGSGKSTLLDALAGFITPQSGTLFFGEQNLLELPVQGRKIGFVFQASALFPHLSVEKNLLLALHDARLNHTEKRNKILDMLALVQLSSDFLRRFPGEVSGGELARLNVARMLLRDIEILLLDEPFSSLDESLRIEMNFLMHKLHRERNLTTLCVTHFLEDAFFFSDKILNIKNGTCNAEELPQTLLQNSQNNLAFKFLDFTNIISIENGKTLEVKPEALHTLPPQDSPHAFAKIELHSFHSIIIGDTQIIVDLSKKHFYKSTSKEPCSGILYFEVKNPEYLSQT